MGIFMKGVSYLSVLIAISAVFVGVIWNTKYRDDFSFYIVDKMLFSQFTRGYFCLHLPDGSIKRYGSNPSLTPSESKCDASMTIYNMSFFSNFLMNAGDVGLGETYAREEWNSTFDDLYPVVHYIVDNVVHFETPFVFKTLKYISPMEWYNWYQYSYLDKSISGDKKYLEIAYELGGIDFYERLIDSETMTFTCGIFNETNINDLVAAQYNKYNILIKKLHVNESSMNILEIGGGWGGFASHLCNKTDNDVIINSINIVEPQLEHSISRYINDNNTHRLKYIKLDYRNIVDKFGMNSMDRIISIGCIEHIGFEKHMKKFFELTWKVLKPGKRMIVHAITRNNLFPKWKDFSTTKCIDVTFIDQYIYPGSCVLLADQINNIADSVGWKLIHKEYFGQHYVKTLKLWRNKWELPESKAYLIENYGTERYKLYHYGNALAEATFRSGAYTLVHYVFIKPDVDNPYATHIHYQDHVFV